MEIPYLEHASPNASPQTLLHSWRRYQKSILSGGHVCFECVWCCVQEAPPAAFLALMQPHTAKCAKGDWLYVRFFHGSVVGWVRGLFTGILAERTCFSQMFICLSFATFQNVIKEKRNLKVSSEKMEAPLCWGGLCCPAPRWWAGMWQAASSYGLELESLNSCLPSSPGWDAFSPALSHPPSTTTMSPLPQPHLNH